MPIHCVDEDHRDRFASVAERYAGDRYREVFFYLMALTRTMWLSVAEGAWFDLDGDAVCRAHFMAANGAVVSLSGTERTLAKLAFALFGDDDFPVSELNDLDDIRWRVAMEAFRIARYGVQRLGGVTPPTAGRFVSRM